VDLLVNGVSLGEQGNATNCLFIWKNVELKPGENQVKASAKLDGKKFERQLRVDPEINTVSSILKTTKPGENLSGFV